MTWVFYLLWLLALPFILLAVMYEKILHLVYWVMDIDDEPRTQRNHKGKTDDDRPETTDEQGKNEIKPPERNQQDDDGMNPQERTLPYITPEPVKEQEPPKKEERPPIIFEFPRHSGRLKPKGKGKEQPDRGRG